MMRLWTWYCKSTIDDVTLDLILQVHSDVLVSPLHTIVMSSPHDGELGTEQWSGGNSGSGVSEPPSSQLWAPVFWPIFLILILRGNNQSLLEAVDSREGNPFLIGWSFESSAVVGRFCGYSLPSETQEWARLNPSPLLLQAIIWVATFPNLDFWSCYKQKTLKQRDGPFHIEKGIKYLSD